MDVLLTAWVVLGFASPPLSPHILVTDGKGKVRDWAARSGVQCVHAELVHYWAHPHDVGQIGGETVRLAEELVAVQLEEGGSSTLIFTASFTS